MKTESKTSGGNIKRKTGLPWLQVDLKDEYVITGVTLLSKDGITHQSALVNMVSHF